MSKEAKNNTQQGGASPHNAYIAKAIVRSAGDACAQDGMGSKTRSGHASTGKPYHYESAGEGWGGNVHR